MFVLTLVSCCVRGLLCLLLLVAVSAPGAWASEKDYSDAAKAYELNAPQDAYIHLKNALQQNPDHIDARLLLARIYFERGEIRSAEKEYEQALLLGADVNRVMPVYGYALILQKKLERLLELEQVADEFEGETQLDWALLQGQAYMLMEQPGEARRAFEGAVAAFPQAPRAHYALVAHYLQQGMIVEAEAALERTEALSPDSIRTWQLRGDLALIENRNDDALGWYTRAYEASPEDMRVLRGMALVHGALGDVVSMQNYLDLMLEQSPDDPAAMLLSAVVKIRDDDPEVAENMLADLAGTLGRFESRQSYEDDGMLFLRAAVEYFRGSDENAINLLKVYLTRREGDLAGLRMLADLYIRNGETRAAADLLARNRELIASGAYRGREGWDLAAVRVLSELYVRNGQIDAAILLLERSSELTESSLDLSILQAQLYIRERDTFHAREAIDRLKRSAKENPRVVLLEAQFLRSIGEAEAALALLRAMELNGDMPLSAGLLRGALQMDLSLFQQAEETASHLRAQHPRNLAAVNFHTYALLRSDALDEALAANSIALKLSAQNTQTLFHRAMLLHLRGEPAQAKVVLAGVLQRSPEHVPALLLMGRLLMDEGQYGEALEWTGKARHHDQVSNRPEELELEIYSRAGEIDNAIAVALALTRADPLSETYLLQLAQLYYREGDYQLMQRPLRRLYSLAVGEPQKLLRVAKLQMDSDNLVEARQSLNDALEVAPGRVPVRVELARMNIREGDYSAALAGIEALERSVGEQREVVLLRAELALAKGELKEAQPLFLRAFILEPADMDTIIELFKLATDGVGVDAFIDSLERTLRDDALPAPAVRMLADLYMLQGRSTDAVSYYEQLLALPQFERDIGILNNLANLYALEDLDKGLVTARQALDNGGDRQPAVLDTVGWIMLRQGRHEEALLYLVNAVKFDENAPELRYHLGAALFALGRKPEARAELELALAGNADFPGRDDARRMVRTLTANP